MRNLPELGEFDLILCLDDAVNYLWSADELAAAFSCAARVLAPSGIFAFDVNSLRTYRTTFSLDTVREGDGVLLAWKGESRPQLRSHRRGRSDRGDLRQPDRRLVGAEVDAPRSTPAPARTLSAD
jgi:hypothetical protein